MHTWEWTEGLGEGKVQLKEIRVQGGFPCKKRNNLLGGAVWKLEQMLVVREDVVEGGILGVANILDSLTLIFQWFQCSRVNTKLRLSLTIHPG